jgi:hypothetical protein
VAARGRRERSGVMVDGVGGLWFFILFGRWENSHACSYDDCRFFVFSKKNTEFLIVNNLSFSHFYGSGEVSEGI